MAMHMAEISSPPAYLPRRPGTKAPQVTRLFVEAVRGRCSWSTRPASDPLDIRPVPRISVQAFCESTELATAFEAAAADRRMERAHVKVHMGGIPAAAEFYSAAPTPNLIVAESQLSGDKLLADLDRLSEVCDAGTKVVVVGHVNDVDLYREHAGSPRAS